VLAGVADDIHAVPMGWETPLLDEATSNLDTVTEAQVHANIATLGCTVIVIVHRLATVIDADLLAARGRYAQLVAGQLVGETPR
jgi:ATP-binding cassette, subfamily B, bacterial